ncbi:MAG: hypothetical protein EZS28_031775 [Streblomastix strix]|uniref:Uncharacterized protein n=1 Tax=Streblomastix strix TaxID=222440 RepID=A0A5J4UQL4_9EUKA|nr:MAG: hypothetical protein EZS28_031775 [Streblomastix strix]
MIYCYLMDIPYKGGNRRRHKSYLPKVMLDKIAAEIRQMEAQHASISRIEVSDIIFEAKSVLQQYYKGITISFKFLSIVKDFHRKSTIHLKHMSHCSVKLIFIGRISRLFRDREILNGDEVAVNLDSQVLLAKSGTNR